MLPDVLGRVALVGPGAVGGFYGGMLAKSGVDLNFHDHHLLAVGKQLFRDGPCFVGGGAGFPAGHLDPVLSQQLLGLIFVKIHFTQTPELA